MERDSLCKQKPKETRARLVAGEIDCKSNTVTRDKGGHYVRIKGLINQGDKIIMNIYASNIRTPK